MRMSYMQMNCISIKTGMYPSPSSSFLAPYNYIDWLWCISGSIRFHLVSSWTHCLCYWQPSPNFVDQYVCKWSGEKCVSYSKGHFIGWWIHWGKLSSTWRDLPTLDWARDNDWTQGFWMILISGTIDSWILRTFLVWHACLSTCIGALWRHQPILQLLFMVCS